MVKPKGDPKPTRIWSGAIQPQENLEKERVLRDLREYLVNSVWVLIS